MREKPLTDFLNSKNPAKKPKKKSTESKGLKGPWELPEGWRWVRLGDLLSFQYGISKKLSETGSGYPILRMNNITYDGKLDLSDLKFVELGDEEFQKYRLEKGDILINRTNSKELVGKTTVFNAEGDYVFASYIIRGRLKVNDAMPEFIALFMNSPHMKAKFLDMARLAVQMANINARELSRILIPLPPPEEQKRIVARLDEISRRLEEAKRLAREARGEAEKLMASALHEVFSKAEERGWEWTKIKDITTDTERVNPTKTPDLEFWYIDIASIDNSTYQISKPKLLKGKEAPSRARKLVKAGDVIFATTRPYLRNIAIVPDWLDNQVCSTGFAVLRTIPEKTIPKWIFYYLISDFAIEQIKPMMRGANYPAITDRDLFNLKIPLPPLEEQKRIVAYLDKISERAQKLVKLYEEREKELEQLFPAILDRAFRGEL